MSRQNLFLVLIAIVYYLFLVNKGIVLYDEGYYFHIADRILQGQVPYRDFFLQFSPGYFYLLALFLKVFGEQIIIGRILTLSICLLILLITLKISDKLKFSKFYQKLLVFLSVVSFGFPLINNPSTLAWISVLISLFLVYFSILWLGNQRLRKYLFLVGLSLFLFFFVKQNLGIYFFVLGNVAIFLASKGKLLQKFKNVLIVDFVFLIPTFFWMYFFFLKDIGKFKEFIEFNSRYASIYKFSYPPLTFLLEPTGIFKIIPYYLPIVLAGFVLLSIFKKNNWKEKFFPLAALAGFFGTVLPTSDLLHVYPFYGSVLVSGLIFLNKTKYYKLFLLFTIISILLGFYLTIFREYYRYQSPYFSQNTTLNLPRTKNIRIDKPLADDLTSLYKFIQSKTSSNDYIFSYPFSPMLYFIFERNNPSKYSIYYPGYLTEKQEKEVVSEIKSKNVKYIITRSEYKFNTTLSKFIQLQKLVYSKGEFNIFEVK